MDPLTPDTPAFDDDTTIEPLLVLDPKPLSSVSDPPDVLDDTPADKYTSPPKPLLPEPTLT